MAVYDAGDLCVMCGEDTSWGSGRFVNRIASNVMAEDSAFAEDAAAVGAELVDGFTCAECFAEECDACHHPIALDEDYRVGGAVYHYGCITRPDFITHLREQGYTPDDGEYDELLSDYDFDNPTKEVTA